MTLDSGSCVWLMAESLVLIGPKSILKGTLEDESRTVVWPQASHTTALCLSLLMCKISVSGKGSQRSLLSLIHSAPWLPERGPSSLLPPVSLPQFISSPEATPPALRSGLSWQREGENKQPVWAGIWCKIHKCSLKYSLTRVKDICLVFFSSSGLNPIHQICETNFSSVASKPLAGIWQEKVTFLWALGPC